MRTFTHCLGKNAAPGHQYKGGCYNVRNKDGSWCQYPYDQGYNNSHDRTQSEALRMAKERHKEIYGQVSVTQLTYHTFPIIKEGAQS